MRKKRTGNRGPETSSTGDANKINFEDKVDNHIAAIFQFISSPRICQKKTI
jgi:hypothetical protein